MKYNPKAFPNVYYKKLKKEYRKIIVKNYIILYTIDENNKVVYISHIYYGKRNIF